MDEWMCTVCSKSEDPAHACHVGFLEFRPVGPYGWSRAQAEAVARDFLRRAEAAEARVAELEERQRFTYCAYCGKRDELDDDAATRLTEHIFTCEKHPLAAALTRAETAEARVAELEEAIRGHHQMTEDIGPSIAADLELWAHVAAKEG